MLAQVRRWRDVLRSRCNCSLQQYDFFYHWESHGARRDWTNVALPLFIMDLSFCSAQFLCLWFHVCAANARTYDTRFVLHHCGIDARKVLAVSNAAGVWCGSAGLASSGTWPWHFVSCLATGQAVAWVGWYVKCFCKFWLIFWMAFLQDSFVLESVERLLKQVQGRCQFEWLSKNH